jgi:hypothetical protein
MKHILLLSAILFCTSIFSQTLGDYEEVVYLKNGSVIRGIIVEELPGKSLKIQTREKNLFVYQFDEVEKITKELYNGSGGTASTSTRKNKGFNAYLDQGLNLWISGDPYPMNYTSIALGYKVNRVFFIGGGTGLLARKGFVAVPVFADIRLTLTKTKVAPLLNFQAGYISPNILGSSYDNYYVSEDSYGGFYFAARPGIGFNLKKDLDLNIYTGYVLGSQIVNTSSYYDSNVSFGLMHNFNFTVGLKF